MTGPARKDALLSAALESLGAGVLTMDMSGRITSANPWAERLVGWTAGQMVGHDSHDLLHRRRDGGTIPREQCALLAPLSGAGPAQAGSDEYFQRSDGVVVPIIWATTPLRMDGRQVGMVLLFHDFSLHRLAAQRTAARTAELETLTVRLRLAAEVSAVLMRPMDTVGQMHHLLRLLVPDVGQWAAVDLCSAQPEVMERVAVRSNRHHRRAARLEGAVSLPEGARTVVSRLLNGHRPVLLRSEELGHGAAHDAFAATHKVLFDHLGDGAALLVPIRTRQRPFGLLTLACDSELFAADESGPETETDTGPETGTGAGDGTVIGTRDMVTLTATAYDTGTESDADEGAGTSTEAGAGVASWFADIGRRVGLALDNARLQHEQRNVAETMQRQLLAPLPQVGHLRMAARYQAAESAMEVGGDWYDSFLLSDGTTTLIIGDVVGHDLKAAVHMAEVRNMLRALAWDHEEPPSLIMRRLDEAVTHTSDAPMATLVFARLEGSEGGPWRLRWVNAGHPPPLLITREGDTRFLEDGHGPLIGVSSALHPELGWPDAHTDLPAESTLLLYTDGLVENRRHPIDLGMAKLRHHSSVLARRLARHSVDDFCDALLERMSPSGDDAALLALQLPPPGASAPGDPQAAPPPQEPHAPAADERAAPGSVQEGTPVEDPTGTGHQE